MPEILNCRSCGKPLIILNHIRTGKPALIEANPVPDGNIVIEPGDIYRIINKDEQIHEDTKRYQSHYVSCPEAKNWRERSQETNQQKGVSE